MGEVQDYSDQAFLLGRLDLTLFRDSDSNTLSGTDVGPEAKQLTSKQRIAAAMAIRLEQRNIRICELLQAATSQQFGRNERQWWKWWLDYNEQYCDQLYRKPVHQYKWNLTDIQPFTISVQSCFSSKTLVHSKSGRKAIVDLKAGDYVLAQNVDTGELAYKLVLATTTRPAERMLNIHVGGEELEATLGHPFWVVGEGWKMAKELRVGDQLQRVNGAGTVHHLEAIQKETTAHNLVVEGFNNYFVGESAILAHDNASCKPIVALVPGVPVGE